MDEVGESGVGDRGGEGDVGISTSLKLVEETEAAVECACEAVAGVAAEVDKDTVALAFLGRECVRTSSKLASRSCAVVDAPLAEVREGMRFVRAVALVAREAREPLESRELRRGEGVGRGELTSTGGACGDNPGSRDVAALGESKTSCENRPLSEEGGLFGPAAVLASWTRSGDGVAGAKTQTVPSSQPTATRNESDDFVVQSSTIPELLLRLAVLVLILPVTIAVTLPLVSFIHGGSSLSSCPSRQSSSPASRERSPAP